MTRFRAFIQRVEGEVTPKKTIVFCHTCNRIVGDHFGPDTTWHHTHNFGNGEMAVKMLLAGQLGFGCYIDTPENRERLARDFPPRSEVTVKL